MQEEDSNILSRERKKGDEAHTGVGKDWGIRDTELLYAVFVPEIDLTDSIVAKKDCLIVGKAAVSGN